MESDGALSISRFLRSIDLEQYAEKFVMKGFDRHSDIETLTPQDLDAIGVTESSERKTILDAGKTLGC